MKASEMTNEELANELEKPLVGNRIVIEAAARLRTIAKAWFDDYQHLKREVSELRGEKIGILKANASLASDNDRLRREVAELNEAIDANLRVHKAAERSDADAKLELNGEIVRCDVVIAELRDCLKEAIADKVVRCHSMWTCKMCGNDNCKAKRWRKVLEGAKDEGK